MTTILLIERCKNINFFRKCAHMENKVPIKPKSVPDKNEKFPTSVRKRNFEFWKSDLVQKRQIASCLSLLPLLHLIISSLFNSSQESIINISIDFSSFNRKYSKFRDFKFQLRKSRKMMPTRKDRWDFATGMALFYAFFSIVSGFLGVLAYQDEMEDG